MTLSNISSATVNTLLQYLSPPSQIPPHLLSKPLRQRHHFLSLSPDDPPAYLAWPSDETEAAIALLADYSPSLHDPPTSYPTKYTADPESVYAHVRIIPGPSHQHVDISNRLPGIRLIFLWNPIDASWQYHNLALMPFPHDATEDLNSVFRSPEDFLQEQDQSYSFSLTTQDVADDADDDYWNAYGQGDLVDPEQTHSARKLDLVNSEDAYWAQYASVQGSGDSTLPSPRPKKATEQAERIIISLPDGPHTEIYNPLEPPSPASLTRRLSALAHRPDSPPLIDDSIASASDTTSSPPLHAAPADGLVLDIDTDVAIDHISEPSQNGSAHDIALKDGIRALYRLWKSTKSAQNEILEQDQELFLSLAQQAIGELH